MTFDADPGDGLHARQGGLKTILWSTLTFPGQMSEPIGPSPEMYLKSLHELTPGSERAQVSAVASRLGVSPVSASEMIHRLADRRLVDYRRYRGAKLTKAGRAYAGGLIRRHRLWERFLYDDLGLPWAAVHDLACELEHAAPDEVTEALAARLGRPLRCPHGNPIPEADGTAASPEGRPLSEMVEGESASLLAIHPESSENLTYLSQLQFFPGTTFTLERVEATDGLRVLRWRGGTFTIGPALASQLLIETEAVESTGSS